MAADNSRYTGLWASIGVLLLVDTLAIECRRDYGPLIKSENHAFGNVELDPGLPVGDDMRASGDGMPGCWSGRPGLSVNTHGAAVLVVDDQ
ncbi:hypothetical protein [Pseudomonas nitroreducens]|uniref:hypothetical protein n=1 Tax=Pseudomonas nitroreducens TaxID=46680 RepID=UPI00209D487D|nr:hypothetical protein [Pseudomonas nitroreducens]MCP1621389.1 hypothetical protein [Pseudomonas nitroreducens]